MLLVGLTSDVVDCTCQFYRATACNGSVPAPFCIMGRMSKENRPGIEANSVPFGVLLPVASEDSAEFSAICWSLLLGNQVRCNKSPTLLSVRSWIDGCGSWNTVFHTYYPDGYNCVSLLQS